jgi:polyisoprenoid-binding protein YceI
MLSNFFFFILILSALGSVRAQERPIDTTTGTIRIHVGKAGILGGAGHEHWVVAPILSGSFDEIHPAINFEVEAAKLKVISDPDLSEDKRLQVQRTMQTEVLASSTFPMIRFQSTEIAKTGDRWNVTGNLTLHGQTHVIRSAVKKNGPFYEGESHFKQTEFGIQPVSVGGKLIKVKDELAIEFKIAPRTR